MGRLPRTERFGTSLSHSVMFARIYPTTTGTSISPPPGSVETAALRREQVPASVSVSQRCVVQQTHQVLAHDGIPAIELTIWRSRWSGYSPRRSGSSGGRGTIPFDGEQSRRRNRPHDRCARNAIAPPSPVRRSHPFWPLEAPAPRWRRRDRRDSPVRARHDAFGLVPKQPFPLSIERGDQLSLVDIHAFCTACASTVSIVSMIAIVSSSGISELSRSPAAKRRATSSAWWRRPRPSCTDATRVGSPCLGISVTVVGA